MKILFVSSVRYPTSKAYGVTISETMRAAREMGYQVEIIAPSMQNEDEFGTRIVTSNVSITKFSQRKIGSLLFNRFKFIQISVLVARDTASHLRKKNYDFIWLRNPYTVLALRCYQIKNPILIEIHHTPKRLQALLLQFLATRSVTKIAVLTLSQMENLKSRYGISSQVIPMGVPKNFFLVRPRLIPDNQKLRVGFIGKATSSGNDNGLIQLSECILSALTIFPYIEFSFIGLEREAEDFLRLRVSDSDLESGRVKFKNHVEHSEVIGELRGLDIGLIPYVDTAYNNMRFPIKSLEYAASGTLILASDIPAHRKLFPCGVAYFYDPLSPNSFCEKLTTILTNTNEAELTRGRAQVWSREYTYESRVEKAMECVFYKSEREK